MKSHFYHIQLNIDFSKNNSFYKELMNFLGWSIIFEGEDMMGYKSDVSGDLWFVDSEKEENQDYDEKGLNHVAIRVEEQKNIDEIVRFLREKNINTLFDTPRHRPEFRDSEDETYYQVMFESPDKILFEIVYIGPK
ncbi:hypothetical protein KC669_01060 [Candidatus Dojkabacteria bacterium]|uniref:VOC domain-containing protein n=1 Tax=Candidatus Dojkabacteria bacterium TaxID=2099670 RepID=A0A955LAU5_9BACT|nr:hypothetical protein [Candidatus Dojkabacteria bacterium]